MSSDNMTCMLVCATAAAFFGAMLFVSLSPYDENKLRDFRALLSPDQDQVYSEIGRERMFIYVMGLVLGLLLGFIYLYFYKSVKGVPRTCAFVFITLGVTYLFYLLYPKSKYMLPYLTTDAQRAAWLRVYKGMQYKHYMGMVLGAIAYVLVSLL